MKIVTSSSGNNRDEIVDADVYVAVITPSYFKENNSLLEMKDAKALGKPMIAVVKQGTKCPPEVMAMPWRHIEFWETPEQFEYIVRHINQIIEMVLNGP